MMLTAADKELLLQKGIAEEKVLQQIETFKAGIPFVHIQKAAIIGDGLLKFSPTEEEQLVSLFEAESGSLSLLKFVPASGAASRMFKSLFSFTTNYDPKKEDFQTYVNRSNDTVMTVFFERYKRFPFYKTVVSRIAGKYTNENEAKHLFVKEMLSENALNYGFFPKGLLPFHDYQNYISTAFEEHLKEATVYAATKGKAKLHFTISPQHKRMFENEFLISGERVSKASEIEFEVSYSFQKPSTDTIAVEKDDSLFRNADGSLLFRPGGHGALIENLNEQDADIVFIKNIDNVVTSNALMAIARSKKILAGKLLEVQKKAFAFARRLENENVAPRLVSESKYFLEDSLNVRLEEGFENMSLTAQIKELKTKINRPIRVCGMVKNEGEPGGGPFWIKDTGGHISLQIVESAQINMEDIEQTDILKNATHFNPVDIVCGIKNHLGEKYNLMQFVNPAQGFITAKTKEGRELKAMELPGLWNGAMAYWNTLFVEVPVITFNPVKTVNDLLRDSHQAS